MSENHVSKKGFILCLILLLVGVSIVSGLSGNSMQKKEQTSGQSSFLSSENPSRSPFTITGEKNHTMWVDITPTTAYAGNSVPYDITVSLLGGGHPSETGLTVALYNATGELVTGDDAWSKLADYYITEEEIILSGGQYYLYAYNDTDDSMGNNATLLIRKFLVIASLPLLEWRIDTRVDLTFLVKPNSNGTLILNNISLDGGNPDFVYHHQCIQISIESGVGLLEQVNLADLGKVTYDYCPDGGGTRPADSLLQIALPTVTPNPSTIFIGEPSVVTVTVTHPVTGAPLEGVVITLEIPGYPEGYSQLTDASGIVVYTVVPIITGDIHITVMNHPSSAIIHIVDE